jgi:hypothetical protein
MHNERCNSELGQKTEDNLERLNLATIFAKEPAESEKDYNA